MMKRYAKSVLRLARRILLAGVKPFQTEPDSFLKQVRGVLHVGANSGQESDWYASHGLNVAWIEPIPEVFRQLQANLKNHPKQRAFQYLVTDQDDQDYTFHIANNNGASSSILELDLHEKIWPEIAYSATMTLRSITLTSLVKKEGLDLDQHNALVMDTQGSELLVLRGGVELLPMFTYIKTEVADFRSYRGCCLLGEMDQFLSQHGFKRYHKHKFASAKDVGSYYDVVYRNVSRDRALPRSSV
jgi:FkbM family methyltransferase